MTGPRDPHTVDRILDERRQRWLDDIDKAAEALYAAFHATDGSMMPGQHQPHTWTGQSMTIASIYLQTALLFAEKAAKEAK